jgi:hypothetical protein
VRTELLSLDPAGYRSHPLHGEDRIWQETNCAADLWIEALHALGVDPTAGLAFTLSSDFDGDQWRMFTYPEEDLRRLYGIEVSELNVWRPLADHVEEQLSLGHMAIIDVDAWFLPDTAGLTYRQGHQKTSVMAQMVDTEAGLLGYFHNAGYYELCGEDFAGVLGVGHLAPPLPPYVMSVRLEGLRPLHDGTAGVARALAAEHLGRRPPSNPVSRLAKRIEGDIEWLRDEGMEVFHRYAFGTVRQCGANAELAASFAAWLDAHDLIDAGAAVDQLTSVAAGMKTVEFLLARAVKGRNVALEQSMGDLEAAWDAAMTHLAQRCGA